MTSLRQQAGASSRSLDEAPLRQQLALAIDTLVDAAIYNAQLDPDSFDDDGEFAEEDHKSEIAFDDARARVDALVAEMARDCERYRWLRQIDRSIEWENLLLCKWGTITGSEQIDAAIDAARAHSAGAESGEGE